MHDHAWVILNHEFQDISTALKNEERERELFHLTLILGSSIFYSLGWTWPWCCNCRLTPLLTLHVSCTQHRGHLSWRRKKKDIFLLGDFLIRRFFLIKALAHAQNRTCFYVIFLVFFFCCCSTHNLHKLHFQPSHIYFSFIIIIIIPSRKVFNVCV